MFSLPALNGSFLNEIARWGTSVFEIFKLCVKKRLQLTNVLQRITLFEKSYCMNTIKWIDMDISRTFHKSLFFLGKNKNIWAFVEKVNICNKKKWQDKWRWKELWEFQTVIGYG